VLRSAAATVAAGVVVLLTPVPALAGDDLRVNPRTVEPGETVTISISCDDTTNAYATSDAFGEVTFDGDRRVDVTVSEQPGRYRVRGMCERGVDWVPEDVWLEVEEDNLFDGDGAGDGERCGRFEDCEEGERCGRFEDCDEEFEPWPDFGPATGGGATAIRAVSPAASLGVGVGVVGAVAGAILFLRRRIGARKD
jgi:hypothetical protein